MRFTFPDLQQPQQMFVEQKINELRKIAKLPPRKTFSLKYEGTQPYFPKPEQAEVTGVKKGRGFTYLNINGGDSWAYWHHEESFEFIHNFKGEPTYKTSEFVPSYYIERLREKRALLTGVREYYVFRDPHTDIYYAGWHEKNSSAHQFNVVGTKAKLIDFLSQYFLSPPKVIQDWTCVFDPHSLVQVNPSNQYWNRFVPSQYMIQPINAQPTCPPTISALIAHVLGTTTDAPLFHGFLNWLAFALQYRRATQTAWMLQGIPGTGKGLLVNIIVKSIFGATNFTARRMEELEDKFNGYLEGCLICYIDEVHIGVSKRADIILANLKNQITEPSITIRNMRQSAYEVPNYLNWIMSSNMTAPIQLDKEDRRFNVGEYQSAPIRAIFPDTTALVAQLLTELPDFSNHLRTLKVDTDAVRMPIKNEARQTLINNSLTSLDVVAEAMLKGDFELLASFMSTETETILAINSDSYSALLKEIAKTGRNKLTRDEIRTIFLHTVGDVPKTPAKFTRFLSHRGIRLKKIRIGDKTSVGIDVDWVISEEIRQEVLTGIAPPILKLTESPDDRLSGVQRSDG